MTKVMTTLSTVRIGDSCFGILSCDRYVKISDTEVRSEEGIDNGHIWTWDPRSRVFVEIDLKK